LSFDIVVRCVARSLAILVCCLVSHTSFGIGTLKAPQEVRFLIDIGAVQAVLQISFKVAEP
jgi:hypothetical protein